MFDLVIQFKEKEDIIIIENLQLHLDSISIKLEEYLLLDLIEYIYRINKMIEKNMNNTNLNSNVYSRSILPLDMLFAPQKLS